MRIINGFRLSAALGSISFAVMFGGSASAAGPGNIAAFCEFHLGLAEIHRSSVFRADDDDRDDWAWEWREHLLAIGVKKEELGRPFCRAWRGADAVESANAAAAMHQDYRPTIRINWVPTESLRSSASAGSSRPSELRTQHAPQKSTPAPSRYVEVAGPNGTQRLSPEVAARNEAAADEYRRKMDEHARAKAEHERKLALHQQSIAAASAEKREYERQLATNAAQVAAHKAKMENHNKNPTLAAGPERTFQATSPYRATKDEAMVWMRNQNLPPISNIQCKEVTFYKPARWTCWGTYQQAVSQSSTSKQ